FFFIFSKLITSLNFIKKEKEKKSKQIVLFGLAFTLFLPLLCPISANYIISFFLPQNDKSTLVLFSFPPNEHITPHIVTIMLRFISFINIFTLLLFLFFFFVHTFFFILKLFLPFYEIHLERTVCIISKKRNSLFPPLYEIQHISKNDSKYTKALCLNFERKKLTSNNNNNNNNKNACYCYNYYIRKKSIYADNKKKKKKYTSDKLFAESNFFNPKRFKNLFSDGSITKSGKRKSDDDGCLELEQVENLKEVNPYLYKRLLEYYKSEEGEGVEALSASVSVSEGDETKETAHTIELDEEKNMRDHMVKISDDKMESIDLQNIPLYEGLPLLMLDGKQFQGFADSRKIKIILKIATPFDNEEYKEFKNNNNSNSNSNGNNNDRVSNVGDSGSSSTGENNDKQMLNDKSDYTNNNNHERNINNINNLSHKQKHLDEFEQGVYYMLNKSTRDISQNNINKTNLENRDINLTPSKTKSNTISEENKKADDDNLKKHTNMQQFL
ncbi:conserved protein, unknown function, partial [Hepatocystis sp. ex Piliocolobus tephrosceles]